MLYFNPKINVFWPSADALAHFSERTLAKTKEGNGGTVDFEILPVFQSEECINHNSNPLKQRCLPQQRGASCMSLWIPPTSRPHPGVQEAQS